MQKLDADDVPHTTQTDHRISRFGLKGEASGPGQGEESRSLLALQLLEEPGVRLPAQEVERALGSCGPKSPLRRGTPPRRPELRALKATLEESPEDVEVLWAAGRAYAVLGELDSALECYRRKPPIWPRRMNGSCVILHLPGTSPTI